MSTAARQSLGAKRAVVRATTWTHDPVNNFAVEWAFSGATRLGKASRA
jgi:hypothetical protein